MAQRKGAWSELGSQVTQIVRSLASWIGLESEVDELAKSITNYNIHTASDLQNALTKAVNKAAKQRDLKIDNLQQRLNEFYNLPTTSRNILKAVQQEKKKIQTEKDRAYDEYNEKAGYADKAQNMLNEYQSQNDSKRAYDSANYVGNIREAINKIEQPAGSNIGIGKI